jgi:hypothetical protein
MSVIVYGDFNCPYSYLASQRADLLSRAGVVVDWRAVEHDRGPLVTGGRSDRDREAWERELAQVASLALPGEHVPAGPPVLISNTKAMVAAYAEAVSDGVAGELRRRLFRAIWVQGLHLSSAYEVRRLVTAVMWPQEGITNRLASPDFPSLLLRDPELARIVRRSGGTIAPDGGPLTTAGWRRIRQWRQEWLALPSQVIPAVIGPDHVVRPGIDGLRYLADLAGTAGLRPLLPACAGTEPGRDARPAAIAARPDEVAKHGRGSRRSCLTWRGVPATAGPGSGTGSGPGPGFVWVRAADSDGAGSKTGRYLRLISTTSSDIK